MTDPETLQKYLIAFGSLTRNSNKTHGKAPHKPILLLALLDEIERGRFVRNHITPTAELIAGFQAYWKTLVTSDYWQPRKASGTLYNAGN